MTSVLCKVTSELVSLSNQRPCCKYCDSSLRMFSLGLCQVLRTGCVGVHVHVHVHHQCVLFVKNAGTCS